MKKLLIFLVCFMCLFVTGCQKKEVVTDIEDASGDLKIGSGDSIEMIDTNISGETSVRDDEKIDISDIKEPDEVLVKDDENIVTESDSTVGYIFPDSSKVKIKESELATFSIEELDIVKNEIFARHGHDFSTKTLREYFENKKWYKAIPGKKVAVSELNEIEQANVALIDKVIRKIKDKNQYVNLNRTRVDNLPNISKVNLDGVDIIIKCDNEMLSISNSMNSNIVERELGWWYGELSIFQGKYLIVTGGPTDEASTLTIYDNGLNEKMEVSIYYGMYRIVDNKIILTDYEFETYEEFLKDNDEKDWINMTPMYRVDYEIVEEGDTFKLNIIREDRKDVIWSAAVT